MKEQGNPGKRYSEETKNEARRRYSAGQSPERICKELGVPQSTFFRWVQKNSKPKSIRIRSESKSESRSKSDATPIRAGDNEKYTPTLASDSHINYIEVYQSTYDYNKAQLQASAINGYCEGMVITDELLQRANGLANEQDRIYATLAVLKERRCIQDRIIKVFSEVSTSTDEYAQIFGRLFNITPKEDKE